MDKYFYFFFFFTGKFGIYKQLKFRLRYYQLQTPTLVVSTKTSEVNITWQGGPALITAVVRRFCQDNNQPGKNKLEKYPLTKFLMRL